MDAVRKAWLLMRSGGCLWGVSSEFVRGVSGGDGCYHVQVAEHLLEVDQVLSLARLEGLREPGPVVGSMVPAGCSAIGLCEHGPLLLIDHRAPPAVLVVDRDQSGEPGEEDDAAQA